ncbi:unnamed protein product [Polarella glacialis]|uniref:RNA helicase n=1 Tax=Polarella glacialis TaxID=89957 RepID=A0A813IQN8_POLGL|nr:unnamed protein product [Polarella glacialis]
MVAVCGIQVPVDFQDHSLRDLWLRDPCIAAHSNSCGIQVPVPDDSDWSGEEETDDDKNAAEANKEAAQEWQGQTGPVYAGPANGLRGPCVTTPSTPQHSSSRSTCSPNARERSCSQEPSDDEEDVNLHMHLCEKLLCIAEAGETCDFVGIADSYLERVSYYRMVYKNILAEFSNTIAMERRVASLCVTGVGCDCSCGSEPRSCDHVFSVRPEGVFTSRGGGVQAASDGNVQLGITSLKDNIVMVTRSGEGRIHAPIYYWITDCAQEQASDRRGRHDQDEEANCMGNEEEQIAYDERNRQGEDEEVDKPPQAAATRILLRGFNIQGERLEHRGKLTFRVLLFAGDFASRLLASERLRRKVTCLPALEPAVLDPLCPLQGSYAKCQPLQTHLLPINEDQRQAVLGLHRRVELIQGPPGTGKSTAIFHMLTAHLPRDGVAVVTCVGNQAINAVAEKLSLAQDADKGGLPMLVLGSPKRIGRTAAAFTLDQQKRREMPVICAKWLVQELQERVDALAAFQARRVLKFIGGQSGTALTRIRSTSDLESIPGLRARTILRLRLLCQRRNKDKDLENEMRKTHAEVVQRGRKILAEAAASLLPIRSCGRSVCQVPDGRFLPLWHVGDYLKHEMQRLARAKGLLETAEAEALQRIIRRSRVFLCTIASLYRLRELQESADLAGCALRRIFMAICDEAAATAETYVPMLLSSNVENLVLFGNQKQLQPLVRARDHKEPEVKKVSRSLMERMIDAGCPARMLTVQYRMFTELCNIVSDMFYTSLLKTGPEKITSQACDELGIGGAVSKHCFKQRDKVEIWHEGSWRQAIIESRCREGGYKVGPAWCQSGDKPSFRASDEVRPPGGIGCMRIRWFDVSGASIPEKIVGTSYVSTAEVGVIHWLLCNDPILGKTKQGVKVITFYKQQLLLLQRTCADIIEKRPNVEFLTVDASQGTEASHVVLSTVRSGRRRIGIAGDPRRFNVAISRAQSSLTVVGSGPALRSDERWQQFYKSCRRKGAVQPVSSKELQAWGGDGTDNHWKTICLEAEKMATCRGVP